MGHPSSCGFWRHALLTFSPLHGMHSAERPRKNLQKRQHQTSSAAPYQCLDMEEGMSGMRLEKTYEGPPYLQAVTTAVGLEFGLASSLFAVALCFTLITMYDAAGVRYHSGKHPPRPSLLPALRLSKAI